jgi:hypothetical protein
MKNKHFEGQTLMSKGQWTVDNALQQSKRINTLVRYSYWYKNIIFNTLKLISRWNYIFKITVPDSA